MKKTVLTVGALLSLSSFLYSDPLPIPPLLEGEEMVLNIQKGELTLPFGTSETLGFNGNYLGPTVRVSDGDDISLLVNNTLSEDSTVHWHGLHVPAEFDGGPHQIVEAGQSWNPRFHLKQKAATLWYHPHLMGRTAEQVYRGLAGMFIIEDHYSRSLDIPSDYGVNDIPLILQDRDIDRQGTFAYRPSMPDVMRGYLGNRMLVNGAYQPELKVKQGTYRFRILNGSNSSVFRIALSDGSPFTVIASDGGFLPRSVKATQLVMTPGERCEILYDFEKNGPGGLDVQVWGGPVYEKALSFDVGPDKGVFYDHPEQFVYEPVLPGVGDVQREFLMETGMMGRFTINGKAMDMNRIDFTLPLDSTEVWTVKNVGMGMMQIPHSFHVHDVQFTVLSVNGMPPPTLLQGPKDTVLLWPGDTWVIAMAFEDYRGVYMYHCHMLEHEDQGMMGQFEIVGK